MQIFTGKSFGYDGETLDDIKNELAEAIKAEDFTSDSFEHVYKLKQHSNHCSSQEPMP